MQLQDGPTQACKEDPTLLVNLLLLVQLPLAAGRAFLDFWGESHLLLEAPVHMHTNMCTAVKLGWAGYLSPSVPQPSQDLQQ